MILFLNGTSSAGKSTIAREILRLSDRPLIYYSIDHLVNYWLDEKFVAIGKEPNEWFYHESIIDDSGNLLTQIIDGPKAIQLHWDMIDSLAVLIEKGYDLVIDEVLWDEEIFRRYVPALMKANKVYLIKIICNLITAEEREKEREDRYQGLARALYSKVYTDFPQYDLQVDTTYTDASENADIILKHTENYLQPQAFLQSIYHMLSFEPLQEQHFGSLQKWLNAPHVKEWWNDGPIEWTLQEIKNKYQTYPHGYKQIGEEYKPIQGFICTCANYPFAYIQFYNAYDFPRDGYELKDFPASLAAIDLLIGDPDYIGKGIAASVIVQFLKQYVWKQFAACLVDPDGNNTQAIRAYEKAGFKIETILKDPSIILMLQLRPAKVKSNVVGVKRRQLLPIAGLYV